MSIFTRRQDIPIWYPLLTAVGWLGLVGSIIGLITVILS